MLLSGPAMRHLLCAAFAVVSLAGCIDDGTGSSSSSSSSTSSTGGSADGGTGVTAAGQACLDTATALANAEVRCGQGDFAAQKVAAINALAGGDCNAVTIRSESQLRSMCIPSLGVIGCSDLLNGRLDPSCAEQIVR